MRVYLAGKISKNDWCHELVKGARITAEIWEQISALPMTTGDTMVGPFFVACDHGCFHSRGTHGARLPEETSLCAPDSQHPISKHRVRQKALYGIEGCDLFIAYLGLDFNSAYGTMAEIGAAHVWGKQIVLVIHPKLASEDFWFLKTMANFIISSDNPVDAVYSLLMLCRKLGLAKFVNEAVPA